MTWGIPRESGIQRAHTRSPAQYSHTSLRRRRQGAVIVGRRRACPGRGRGGRAPRGGSSRRGRAAAPEAPPGPAARLPSAEASRGRPAAPRTSYWGAAPPAPAPPARLPPTGRPLARLLRSARAPSDSAPARVGSAPSRGLPPAPAAGRWRAGCTRLGRSSSRRRRCYRPGSHKAPEWSCTRAHTPAQPPPRALPPASLPRRPLPPRTHTSHSHQPRPHSRAHTCAGGGEGDPGRGLLCCFFWGGGGAPKARTLLDPQKSPPACQFLVPSTARARSPGAGRGAGELAPAAGRRGSAAAQPARPAGGDAPSAAGSRGTRSPPSAKARCPASSLLGLAGRRLPENDQQRVPSLIPALMESELAGAGVGAGGDRIQRELPKLG